MGGPSKAAKDNQAAQTAFMKATTDQQNTAFGEQQQILREIQAVSLPLLMAGPNQYGFTPEQDALLKGQILDNEGQAIAHSLNAEELRERQSTGGADLMSSGGKAQVQAMTNVLAEQDKAKQLTSEKLEGYKAGAAKYQMGLAALTGNAGMLNPTAYTTAATGAENAATGAVNLVDSERSHLAGDLLKAAVGGAAGSTKPFGVCYRVAILYNEDVHTGVRVNLMRNWLEWNRDSELASFYKHVRDAHGVYTWKNVKESLIKNPVLAFTTAKEINDVVENATPAEWELARRRAENYGRAI